MYLPTVLVLFKGFSIFVDQFHTISSAERRGSVEEEEEGAGEEEEEEEKGNQENKDKISKLTQIKVRQSFPYSFFFFIFHFIRYAACRDAG